MRDLIYLLTPFLAWLVAGSLKFLINCIRAKRLAFDLIGYGGLPSNHTAIVCSMAALIAFQSGINSPAFGVAIALAFIVVLDASSLRRQVGKHAAAINELNSGSGGKLLRERMGHTRIEIVSGALVGIVVAYLVSTYSSITVY
jgi:acid phosphatase family membrane protein YuiD